ncbi:MAG: phage baseplate assembly protein V [Prevotella sp.]|jgi:hypothetical protein|nr:phage baseplate assembly protein V [Prevotella sp.]
MGNIRTTEVQAIVNIDGEKVDFIRLKIEQEMGHHDEFEVLVDYKTFTETFHDSPDKFLKKTNTKVVIDLLHADQPGNAYVFAGMVENIRMISEDGAHGAILFKGKGNTIELERGNMMQTYSHTNLQTIFREITGGTMNLSSEIKPTWQSDIDFTIQYHESDWVFLQRLCNQFQENFYYTGTELVIGKFPAVKTVELTYDMELRRFEVCSRLQPNQFSTYYYDRDEHKMLEQDSPGSIDGANNLLNIVSKRSDNLTISRKPNTPTEAYIPDMGSLIDHTKRRKVTTGARMMYAYGECKTCDVRIGRIINVSMPKNLGGSFLGSYRVYSIVHEFDQKGRYISKFEAIQSDLEYIPTPKIHVPTPNLIQAEVWDNEDPDGMGRIRVQFPFDEKPCLAWIPIMTPDAGGKDAGLGPASRGYSFISEIDDTVAISFLDGSQLCHPVAIGSMFHGKNAENLGGGKKNNIKTIVTRSGHTIKFDDTKEKEKIQIYDYKGNIVEIDTPADTVNIFSNKAVNITTGTVNITASQSINATAGTMVNVAAGATTTIDSCINTLVGAGNNISINAGKTIGAVAKKEVNMASGAGASLALDSKGKGKFSAKKNIDVTSQGKLNINSTKNATIKSKKTQVTGQSKMTVTGSKVEVK